MDDRTRVFREIRRNVALIVDCEPDDVEVLVNASASTAGEGTTFRAVAQVGDKIFVARGDDEDEALAELLDLAVDGANAEGVARHMLMTPALQGAFRLLQLTRLELIEEIRRELASNPELRDD